MFGIYRPTNIDFAIAWIQQCLGLRFSIEDLTHGTCTNGNPPLMYLYQLQVDRVMIICEKLTSSWLII